MHPTLQTNQEHGHLNNMVVIFTLLERRKVGAGNATVLGVVEIAWNPEGNVLFDLYCKTGDRR